MDISIHTGVMGSYVEEKLIDAEKLVKIPDGIEFTVAAALILKGMTTQVLLRKVFKVSIFGEFLWARSCVWAEWRIHELKFLMRL